MKIALPVLRKRGVAVEHVAQPLRNEFDAAELRAIIAHVSTLGAALDA